MSKPFRELPIESQITYVVMIVFAAMAAIAVLGFAAWVAGLMWTSAIGAWS